MAILFYEGLPRSGKSYEAVSNKVGPALLKGREVVAYIEGLDDPACQEKIAEVTGLAVERVRELLFPLTREDMRPRVVETQRNGKKIETFVDGPWIEKTRDNAFHIFDEAQNWWPVKHKASEALTQFVTEHGHRGIDILLMGQSLKDTLALWRRRVDQKFTFLKLTALGTDKRYRVAVYKGQGDDKYVKVADKIYKYDTKWFGTYKSHVSGDTNTETFTDSRASFANTAFVRYGVPLMVVLLAFGLWKSWAFFHPAPLAAAAKPGSVSAAKAIPPAEPVQPVVGPAVVKPVASPPVDSRTPEERYFAELGGKGRARLGALVMMGGRTSGIVEWVEGNGSRVLERIDIETLVQLGVKVRVTGPTVLMTMGQWTQLATPWPIEAEGRVSDARNAEVRAASSTPQAQASAGVSSGPGLTIIGESSSGPVGAPAPAAESRAQPRVQPGSKWSFQPGAAS